MALHPEEIIRRIAQSDAAFKDKDFDRSILLLQSIIENNPNYAPAHKKLGFIWLRTDTPKRALPYLERALALAPDDGECWAGLGYYHKNCQSYAAALTAFSRSVLYLEKNTQLLCEILELHLELNDKDSALKVAEKLLEMEPQNITYRWKHAKLLWETEKKRDAVDHYDRLVKSESGVVPDDLLDEWLEVMVFYKRISEARKWLRKLSESHPDNVAFKLLYGRSCEKDLDIDEALLVLEDIHGKEPENPKIKSSLGALYKVLGKMDKSEQCFSSILDNDPLNTSALFAKAMSHSYSYGDSYFKQLSFAEANIDTFPPAKKSTLHYALGKAYCDVGDLATGFEHYGIGGAIHSNGKHYNVYTNMLNMVKLSKEKMHRNLFSQKNFDACQSNKPLFIVGMPRSGTTLMEQVLSGIDGVYGAGELPFGTDVLSGLDFDGKKLFDDSAIKKHYSTYKERGERYLELTEALAPESAKRIIDKMPDNFKFVGPLHLILPNASFIHSRRHPVETCLSAYRIKFAHGHYWSDDLRTMGRYYRLYTEMMAHWHSVLPKGTILDVRYEDMVNDLETQSKRIAAYIDMPWSPKCLEFHTSKKPVRTASLSQVRQPLYKTSMNRWRKYEPYLKPLLDEIGDLVEAYEKELETT